VSRGLLALLVLIGIGGGTVLALTSADNESAAVGGPPAKGAEAGSWTTLTPGKYKRTEVGAARIGRHIYVVGGFEERGSSTSAAVERYDIRRNRWGRVSSMPVALNHPAAVAYQGRLYVTGGYRGRGDLSAPSRGLFRYDPATNRWSRLPSAPTPRAAHAAGVIGGRLHVAGGANESGALRSLEIYDIVRRRWSKGPDMSTMAREHVAGTVAGGQFYVLAGRASGQGNFRVAERFDPARGRWERLPDMAKARGGIAAATVDGQVVVLGGEEGAGTIGEVELFNPAKRRWSRLPDLATPRHGLGAASFERRVYAIEGGPEPGFHFSDKLEALDLP